MEHFYNIYLCSSFHIRYVHILSIVGENANKYFNYTVLLITSVIKTILFPAHIEKNFRQGYHQSKF